MQLSWVLALLALSLADASASCVSRCQSDLTHHKEEACTYWRSRLPRPDLYMDCGKGFTMGKKVACEGYCSVKPNPGRMAALRLDACSSYQRVPPIDRQDACRSGFTAALDRAKAVAVVDEVELGGESEGFAAPDAAGEKKKKKIGIKKAPAVEEPKDILYQAREEAAAAFMDAKASEL